MSGPAIGLGAVRDCSLLGVLILVLLSLDLDLSLSFFEGSSNVQDRHGELENFVGKLKIILATTVAQMLQTLLTASVGAIEDDDGTDLAICSEDIIYKGYL